MGTGARPDDATAEAGWKAIHERLTSGKYAMSDEYVTMLVAKIEREYADRPPPVRKWMIAFLDAAAAARGPELAETVRAATERLGESG